MRNLLLSLSAAVLASCASASWKTLGAHDAAAIQSAGEISLVETTRVKLCEGNLRMALYPPLRRDGQGNLFALWGSPNGPSSMNYFLSVCQGTEWIGPRVLFSGGDREGVYFAEGMLDADGGYKVVRYGFGGRFEVFAVNVNRSMEPAITCTLESSVEVPSGFIEPSYLGSTSALMPDPRADRYVVAGRYSELDWLYRHDKWWWTRIERGSSPEEPRAFFKGGPFDALPSSPGTDQLAVGRDGTIHAAAGWWRSRPYTLFPTFTVVHCWLEGEVWRTEEVYRGEDSRGVCWGPMLLACGDTWVIGGTFQPPLRYDTHDLLLWAKKGGAWELLLEIDDAYLQAMTSDADGRLYVLYDAAARPKGSELLVRGSQGWSGPFLMEGVQATSGLLVQDGGVVHIVGRAIDGAGTYIRLEPAAKNRSAAKPASFDFEGHGAAKPTSRPGRPQALP